MSGDRATGRLVVLGAAALLLVAIVVGFRDSPILLQFQSVQMVHAANSLTSGAGLEVEPGTPFARWPPLYPVLLSLLQRSGMAPIPAAYLINGLAFVVSLVGLHGLCGVLRVRRAWLVLIFWAAWAPNWYLLRAVRPDGIAICASILVVWALARYFHRPSWGLLVLTALLCALATMARYMTVFTLVPLTGAVVLFARHPGTVQRLVRTATFSILAAAPIALWFLRNHRLTGYLSGMSRSAPRKWAEEHTLLENVALTAKTLALDAFSFFSLGVRLLDDAKHPQVGLVAASAIVVLVLGVAGFLLDRRGVLAAVGERLRAKDPASTAVFVSASYVVLYIAMLWALWTVGNSDPINTRYVSPIYPFVLAIGFWLYTVMGEGESTGRARIAWILVGVLVLAPNTAKSARLLQDAPGKYLTEVRETRLGTWKQDVDWSRPGGRALPNPGDTPREGRRQRR